MKQSYKVFTRRKDMPHELLQSLLLSLIIPKQWSFLLLEDAEKDVVVGVGQ